MQLKFLGGKSLGRLPATPGRLYDVLETTDQAWVIQDDEGVHMYVSRANHPLWAPQPQGE
jgi:hypothetical protein